jgi:hypothetical protein
MSLATMTSPHLDFTTVRNQHEQAVFRAVIDAASRYPGLAERPEALLDAACVALNRLPARYIRHPADFAFFQTAADRVLTERSVAEAAEYALGYVQARDAMKARG